MPPVAVPTSTFQQRQLLLNLADLPHCGLLLVDRFVSCWHTKKKRLLISSACLFVCSQGSVDTTDLLCPYVRSRRSTMVTIWRQAHASLVRSAGVDPLDQAQRLRPSKREGGQGGNRTAKQHGNRTDSVNDRQPHRQTSSVQETHIVFCVLEVETADSNRVLLAPTFGAS